MGNKENRIWMFDNLKLLLMMLVVVGHFADTGTQKDGGMEFFRSVYLFIYAFHMPLFIFVSGHFHRNKNIVSRVLSLTAIGFALKVFQTVVRKIVQGNALTFSLLSDAGIPWFMFALAAFNLLSYVTRNIDKRFMLVLFGTLSLFAGYDPTIANYLYLSRIIVFYPYYLLGQMISTEHILKWNKAKGIKILSVLVLAVWAVVSFWYLKQMYVLRPLFLGRVPYSQIDGVGGKGLVYRLVCYGISLVTGAAVVNLVPSIHIPGLSRLGARTLQPYFWHLPLLTFLGKLGVFELFNTNIWGRLLWLCLAAAIAIILCLKPFGFPVTTIVKYSQEIKE